MAGATIGLDDVRAWIDAFAASVHQHREELTELDAAIGDADHGANMDRGLMAVADALATKPPADAGELLATTGMTLVSKVGGASGPLFGTFFMRMGAALKGTEPVDLPTFAAALDAGVQGVLQRGKANVEDKTMYDALAPALAAVQDAADLPSALVAAAEAARKGCEATISLVARKGRASYLGERSAGHQDPGATSVALLFETAVQSMGS